jgi:hypothetical protein
LIVSRRPVAISGDHLVRKLKGRVAPRVEALESRECLSGASPVFTMRAYRVVTAEIRGIVRALARTHDVDRARTALTLVASQVPYGRQQLLPAWQDDLATVGGRGGGFARILKKALIMDLKQDLVAGVAAGLFDVIGPGSSAFHHKGLGGGGAGGGLASSIASVTLVNNTGLNLTVTASLNGTSQTITKPIGANSSALFDFGSSSTNSISISIRRSDGLQPPPSRMGILLNRPIGGYQGKSFGISVFANLFSVSG